MRIPNAHYTDPAILAAELRTTFAAPLLVAPSASIPTSGDFRTLDLMGTPVVVVRGADGRPRVLLNVCRHRGAQVAEGSGCRRRLTCTYHGWTYDTEGALVGIPGREGFDDIDVATHGLVELPSEERHGYIWGLRDPNGVLDLDAHLGPFDAELASWGYHHDVASVLELELASNWKCALEAFLETYHFPYVHADSMVGRSTMANVVTFDQIGRHHRLGVPTFAIGTDEEPAAGQHLVLIYYIYPCTVIATSVVGAEMLQFYPGSVPGRSTIRYTILSRYSLSDPEVAAFYEAFVPAMQAVIRDEDAPVLERSGIGLAAGHTDVVLGRNEIGCQAAHRQILVDLAGDGGVTESVQPVAVRALLAETLDQTMGDRIDVAVLGAGFGGLAVVHVLAEAGVDDVVIFERSDGVGGTWRQNTYPGAACDIPSHLYSLSFAPNPYWSRTYGNQPEILAYLEACFDRFDVRRKVRCNSEIVAAHWCADRHEWVLHERSGREHRARFMVSAIGMFHTPSIPAIPGAGEFGGTAFHSARRNHDHDLTGEHVAVIGTGASAIQIVPAIAEQVGHLDVYQRTPPWIVPRKNDPFTEEQQRHFAEEPDEATRFRRMLDEQHEESTAFLAGDPRLAALTTLALGYLDRKVSDDDLRDRLTPRTALGCTRLLISSDYFPAIQRTNVELHVDPIERITPSGIRTIDGRERPCDTIVWCTGFHAHDYLKGIEVSGRSGRSIHELWGGVPRAFHGIAVPDFPNLFLIYGPNTNQGGNSIILILEAQAQVVARVVGAARRAGAARIEVREEAMARYSAELEAALGETVWATGCTTYFHSAGGDVVTQLPHSAGWYRSTTENIDWTDFELTPDRRTP